MGAFTGPQIGPSALYRGNDGQIMYDSAQGQGGALLDRDLDRFTQRYGDPNQYLPQLQTTAPAPGGAPGGGAPGGDADLLRSQFLQQLYGTRDSDANSPTFGQSQPLDAQFLSLLNNREVLPAPVQTGGQVQQSPQFQRKLDFMTSQNPQLNPPSGPPMARDNGQALGRA